MEGLEGQRPVLVQAYHPLPLFRDWLLERYYQDVNIDPRDSVEKHAGEPNAPAWIQGGAAEPAQVLPEQEAPVEEATAPVEQPAPPEQAEADAPQAEEAPEPSLAPNVEEYLNLKAQHPDKIIGVRVGEYLLFYGKDVEAAAPALGTKVLTRDIDGLGTTAVTGSNLAWQAILNELMAYGVSVVLAEQDPERGPEAPYQVIKERDASDYIPIGMELTVQGRRMKVHSVNYGSGTVDLQDLELRGWYPIFRTESVPFVRQFVEDEQQRELEAEAQEPLAASALDQAKDLIQQFFEKEYGDEVEADFSDLTKVNLAYTTTEDERHEIQVTADLEACTVTKSVDGVPAEKTAYPGLDELIDHELRDMTFDELVHLEKDPSRMLEPVSMDGGKVSDYTIKTVGTVNAGAFDVVFQEIPGEVTLALNLSGCPNRCAGCHSPHLWEEVGEPLDDNLLNSLLSGYGNAITCVCFMGGDAAPGDVAHWSACVRAATEGRLKTGWYSGRSELAAGIDPRSFDYIKLGPYVAHLGGLDSASTNQRLYRVTDGEMKDITAELRNRDRMLLG